MIESITSTKTIHHSPLIKATPIALTTGGDGTDNVS